jgi:hypothetical protein
LCEDAIVATPQQKDFERTQFLLALNELTDGETVIGLTSFRLIGDKLRIGENIASTIAQFLDDHGLANWQANVDGPFQSDLPPTGSITVPYA